MKITLLAQGSTTQERAREYWGVAFLIGRDMILDTFGNAQALMRSLKKHNVDLLRIKHIVVSHDHWDHTNGLWRLLPFCPKASVYVCRRVSKELKQKIFAFGVKVVEVEKTTLVAPGIYTTGQLKGRVGEQVIYEQSLVLPSSKGFVLLAGCAHPGIDRIVSFVCRKFRQRPFWIAGGFHLKSSAPAVVQKIARSLIKKGVKRVSPFHCTGEAAAQIFCDTFGAGYIPWPAGSSKRVR